MTITHRAQAQPEEILAVSEPGLQFQCDACECDLTHSIRVKCADPICEPGDGVDICPACFCKGKEFLNHKRTHAYRVVELHSYPIFTDDWGADEELLLIEGISLQGFGNWQAVSEHIGTRTKEEVEKHYNSVYVNSSEWPLPVTNKTFNVDPAEFQERKRRRIAALNAATPPAPKLAPTSAPAIHEIATYLPGRFEFEHELDNEAEGLVQDLEFGVCLNFGGDQIMEDENDLDVKARLRWEEEKRTGIVAPAPAPAPPTQNAGKSAGTSGVYLNGKGPPPGGAKGKKAPNGTKMPKVEEENAVTEEDAAEEIVYPPPIETVDSLKFKLTLMEMYKQRVEKRMELKQFLSNRGLLEYKKMQATEKRRTKEEKDIVHRLRPFARLQTAADFEEFQNDMLYEALLRKRIQELQLYRRMGLTTLGDIEKFDSDIAKRSQAKANLTSRDYYPSQSRATPKPRQSSFGGDSEDGNNMDVDGTPGPSKAPQIIAPLNLANSPSLHLLTQAEQLLCSQLRILPKPYLVIKETLIREYARRGGKLRRREARDLVKVDVNKTSKVWDFLVQAGFLRITADSMNLPNSRSEKDKDRDDGGGENAHNNGNAAGSSGHTGMSLTPSPTKEGATQTGISPRPSIPPPMGIRPSTSGGSGFSISLPASAPPWPSTQ